MLDSARAPSAALSVFGLLLLLLPSLFPAYAQDVGSTVEVERFRLTCPSSAVEGDTLQCAIAGTGADAAAWPVVGILHLSSDADRALVRGVPADVALQAQDGGTEVDGGVWWIGDVLVGYARVDLAGESDGDGDTRTISIMVHDDGDYEAAERFYVALAENGRRGVGALYLNRRAIQIGASDTRSADASLTDLDVTTGDGRLPLAFVGTTTSYVASVAYEVAEAVVTPTASHGRAMIAVQGVPVESGAGSAGVALGVGATRVETVVTAEDGSSRTYVIDVTRAARGDNVEVEADGFTLTCPAAVDEGTDVSCTLANGSGGAADWPVVAILHSSVDADGAVIAEDPLIPASSSSFATDVGLAAEQTPARSDYNFGYGELFSGESRSIYTTYGYEKFDWAGAAADEEQRSVVIGVAADDAAEEEETFYVALAPSGYTGLSDLVDNKVPLVVLDASAEAPGAPAGVAVATGDGELTVSWVAPAADGGNPVTGYVVQWKADGEDYDATREALAASPHTVEGLQNGTEYTVRVVAVNEVGRSEPSAEASGTPSRSKASSDATLSALTLSGVDIGVFDGATASYAGRVENGTSSTIVTATPNDGSATVVIGAAGTETAGRRRDVPLTEGSNAIAVVVTAADGMTSVRYDVAVTREGQVTITAASASVAEGTAAMFELGRTGSTDEAVSVSAAVAQTGSVLAGSPAAAVSIGAGEATATLSVATEDDRVVEADGAVTVELGAGTGYAVGTPGSATVAVEDGDTPSWHVSLDAPDLVEGGAATLTVSAGEVTFEAEQSLAVRTVGGSAERDRDYTVPATITVAAGAGSADVTVEIADDAEEEDAEDARLAVLHGDAEVGTASFTIAANDERTDDATLATLALSGVAFDFRGEIEDYAVNAGQLESTTITATPSDADASVVVDPVDADAGNGHQVRLSVGENVVAATVTSEDGQITKTYTVRVTREELGAAVSLRRADRDFDGLAANVPFGLWSDDTTLWVATWWGGGLLAFDLGGGGRTGDRDIETASDNGSPVGLWSDGETLWAAEYGGGIYAYRLSDGERVSAEDLGPTMTAAGNEAPTGLWSDGSTLWVADRFDAHVYAYRLSDKTRDGDREFGLDEGTRAYGLWSDGTTMWVADFTGGRVAAYALTDGARDEGRDYDTSQVGNGSPTGLWSDGATLWVGDRYDDEKLYAYALFGAAEAAASADATLGGLSLSGVDIGEFDSATTGYAADVANGVSSTTVTASPTNPAASVTIADGDGSAVGTTRLASLAVGRTDIAVTVTAADGETTATYTVAVTRAASSDATLSALSLSGIDIGPFDAATLNYAASVGHQVSSTTVNAVAADAAATVTIADGDDSSEGTSRIVSLSVGWNEVSVSVTAGDGQTTAEYMVAVTRAAPPPSDDATLSGLSLTGVNIGAFDGATTAYTASVGHDVTSTTVTATANDAGASVTIADADGSTTGAPRTVSLSVGENAITVTVSAADDETTATYTVSVTRAASSDATLSGLSLSGVDIGTFDGATTAYAGSVGHDVTSTTVTATANDAGASVTIADADGSTTDAPRAVTLSVGENAITATVSAADGETTATYSVAVTRARGPLTAEFEDVPAEHYGSLEFELGIRFSEEFPLSYKTVRRAVKVEGGVVRNARRTEPGSNLRWRITVRPQTVREVTVRLPGGRPCDAVDAICTADGRALSNSPTATLPGPDFEIAADAESVSEGTSAEFTVTRAGAAELKMQASLLVTESGNVLRGPTPRSVIFERGENSVALMLATDDDAVSEADSTVTATLDIRPTRVSASVTVRDDDEATFAISAEPAEIEEGATSTVTVSIDNGVTFAEKQTLSLSATGTATAADYTLKPTTLTLAAGAGAVEAALAATDDAAKEDDETVVVSATLGGSTVGEATVTITANDASASDDATLAALVLSGIDLGPFDPETMDYAAEVEQGVDETSVTATPNDEAADVVISDVDGSTAGTTRTTRLAEGTNAVGVEVTAEDGIATRNYGVTVTRAVAASAAWGERRPERDIDLSAADRPRGLWSDGETLWTADWDNGTVLAYALADGSRAASKDFTLGEYFASALWSDGETLWVADYDGGVYAYRLDDGERLDDDLDAETLAEADNEVPTGLWSDGDTLWVADHGDGFVYAYGLADGARREEKEFTLRTDDDEVVHIKPFGLFSDGETALATDWLRGTVRGYWLSDGARHADRDIGEAATVNRYAAGLWSDGETLWVVDELEQKAVAYAAAELRDPPESTGSLVGEMRSRAAVVPGDAAAGPPVSIPDAGLRGRIVAALGKSPGDTLGARELAALEVLDARNAGVASLAGLEHAVNLEGIDLGHNEIADQRPLSSLPALRRLNLDGATTDLWPLAGLTKLTGLSLRGNGIEDISALSGLKRLTVLDLAENRIGDLAPVAQLSRLQTLRLDGNRLRGLSALAGIANLRYLSLRGNDVVELQPLSGLRQLQTLDLRDNRVEDLSPLAGGAGALRLLDVRGNGIVDFSPVDGRRGLRVIDERERREAR